MNKALAAAPNVTPFGLDDKYAAESGRVFLTGTQALVRLALMQRRRDEAAGLNTAGFVTGYRGSPLGGVDQQFQRARKFLDRHHIRIQPAVNEDLGATAIWGTQQLHLSPGARYDGVFAMWYGKGPGVDRSGDVFKHANLSGSARHGGVLAVFGDDHTCKSSTTAHQSEFAFIDAMIPVLSPSGVQEFLDLGIYGWALSRFAGCWVAMKAIADTVDCTASVYVDPERTPVVLPDAAALGFEMPADGLNARWPDQPLAQEQRLHTQKRPAMLAFARANRLDRQVFGYRPRAGRRTRLGIVTTGKSHLDTRQALEDLGITPEMAERIGVSVFKVGMPWPLDHEAIGGFVRQAEEVLVIEEKRALIEPQLKDQAYYWPADERPLIIGKRDDAGDAIMPTHGELTPAMIARVIAARIGRFHHSDEIDRRLAFLARKEEALAREPAPLSRIPYFCSGCPHNTSTMVPEGSRAFAGIGCHYMATWMDRRTETFTHMGGEGASWAGLAHFTDEKHVYVNMGDGTYYHSGLLAIRQAVAAGVNVTFKLLYNDAVAMTGGQAVDGPLSVPRITHQLTAEGVAKIIVVAEDPAHYSAADTFAAGVTVHDRTDFARLQRELRDVPGVTALIYDQTCAAEKRRRRKRGTMPDPPKRVFINQAVCEGCGDCSVQSNCLSVVPVETEFGRKRAIDQSTCNKDYSCLRGFCPSFVTVHGGDVRRSGEDTDGVPDQPPDIEALAAALPAPSLPDVDDQYGILITGIGGTGVVTLGAVIGAAAHAEGKGVQILDHAGLAQKGGAVVSHVRIGGTPEDLSAIRLSAGGADLLLAADLIVAGSFDSMAKLDPERSRVVVNTHETITGAFLKDPDFVIPGRQILSMIDAAAKPGATHAVDASRLATALLGDSITTNIFLLGYAWQKGLLPLSEQAIMVGIELNAGADDNRRAFLWGRLAAHDPAQAETCAAPLMPASLREPDIAAAFDDVVARRQADLVGYQDRRYGARYRRLVDRVAAAERALGTGDDTLALAVARGYHKLLAYKDEYEVARLFSDGSFAAQLHKRFEGKIRLRYHMAPPVFARRDPDTGHLVKRQFGPWMGVALAALARAKVLRGTAFDPFARSAERRQERQLIADYEDIVDQILAGLTADNLPLAVELASLPEEIRGFGHVKQAAIDRVKARESVLLQQWHDPGSGRGGNLEAAD